METIRTMEKIMNDIVNRIGKKYGRWTVTEFSGFREYKKSPRRSLWKCICDCGVIGIRTSKTLESGSSSCGCIQKEAVSAANTKHGKSRTKIYKVWTSMRLRCNNKLDRGYDNYGGRGIKVCERWETSFENFLADMGYSPPGMSLDRIDNDGDYEPENCRWATPSQQLGNQRKSVRFKVDGVEMCLMEISIKYKISYNTLHQRVRKGMSIQDAISKPIDTRYKRR